LAALLTAAGAPVHAEEVMTEHQGLDVLGNLEIARGKSLRTDGVVLLVHGTLGHNRMEVVSATQELLRERGVNSLAITRSLGLDKRRGMFECNLEQDHRHEDAVEEIDTWVAWLREKGATVITLAGHDRGAAQAALYASLPKADRSVRRLVLIAPLLQTFEAVDKDYFLHYKKVLRDELTRAQDLVSHDEASSLIDVAGFLDCPNAKVTAGAFADYYAANQKFFTPSLLPSIRLPTLVIGAELDPQERELTTAMRGLPEHKNISFHEVRGADHFFRDTAAEEMSDRVAEFLSHRLEAAAVNTPLPPPSQGVKMKTRK
jgi:pimeloyl-ACP methyl ester carboxylesterase